jgi:hypothetical protein
MPSIDRDSRVTIDWLRAREAGAVVRWASDHLTPERPWARGWVDVRITEGGPPDMAWVWTILTPEDPEQGEPGQLWQFAWPYDAETSRWGPGSVCDALTDWAARHAGRADLRFEWDRDAGRSPSLERAAERAAAGGRTWDLGDGLEVADGVMDDLLALDPAEAARMTTILREASRRFRVEESR